MHLLLGTGRLVPLFLLRVFCLSKHVPLDFNKSK